MKIEQIAFFGEYSSTNQLLLRRLFGMEQWIQDQATGVAWVYGNLFEDPITAHLAFNEQAGIQFETLDYEGDRAWVVQRAGGRLSHPVLSHIGCHVDSVEEELIALPFPLAQLMITYKHTNPFLIDQQRSYIYAVLDSEEQLGFDLKLIQRVEGVRWPTQQEARLKLERLLALVGAE